MKAAHNFSVTDDLLKLSDIIGDLMTKIYERGFHDGKISTTETIGSLMKLPISDESKVVLSAIIQGIRGES
jgi:hypothetical protein